MVISRGGNVLRQIGYQGDTAAEIAAGADAFPLELPCVAYHVHPALTTFLLVVVPNFNYPKGWVSGRPIYNNSITPSTGKNFSHI
jgi:hypothetical protein